MQPEFGISEALALLAASHGFLLAFFLIGHRRGNRVANRWLAILIFVFSLRLLEIVAFWTQFLLQYPWLSSLTAPFGYLFGVLLFFYVRTLLTSKTDFHWHRLLHFIPFIAAVTFNVPYYLMPDDLKAELLRRFVYTDTPVAGSPWTPYFIVFALQFVHIASYLVAAMRLISSQNESQSSVFHEKIRWLQLLMGGFVAFFCTWLLYNIAVYLGYPYHAMIDHTVSLTMSFWLYAIAYHALKQPEIFSGALGTRSGLKYEKSTLRPGEAEAHLTRLEAFMEQERPYLNSELKLADVAERLQIPLNHLSQIINEYRRQNFFDFVNSYRVSEVQRLVADPTKRHLTLLALAFEVGFNNKTSFNTAFKKHTGMTPSQYRRSLAAVANKTGATE